MKKSMMNIVLCIIVILACINGCVMDSPKEEISIGKDNTAEKAYLSLSLNESRTVLPQSLDQTKLTWTLVGHYNNEDKPLGEWSYAEMLAARIELFVGQWDFTLTANDGEQNMLVGNITNYNVVAGDNQLSFTMKEYSTGTGIISVTARMPHGKVAKVEAVLRKSDDDTLINSQQLTVNDCTDDPAEDYALYELNSANKGLYTLTLRLYQGESDTESINKQMMLVRVEPGCISSGTVTFEQVNTYWHIIYHFEDFDDTDDLNLITKYNEDMQIILPRLYQNDTGDYYCIDYYNNTDRTGDIIKNISYDNSGDIELWVKSKSVLAVSSSGLSAYLDTLDSAGGPYSIMLADKNPDMSVVKAALLNHNNIKVDLDMTGCISLMSIETDAFQNCTSLTGIIIPDNVTSIAQGAFSGCSGLESITIPFVGDKPHTPEDTYQYPFGYIFGTSSYTGGTATTQYYCGSSTYSTTSTKYYIPTSLKSVTITCSSYIPRGAFDSCSRLMSVTIPNSVTSIGNSTFSGCSGLTSVTIPDSVTSIGEQAFYNCSGLTSIKIPDSVTSIGGSAFWNCSGLTRVDYTGTIADWCGVTFGYNSNPLYYAHNLYINGELVTDLVIPNTVTEIKQYAFYYCSGLTSVTIPDSVTSIGNEAFSGCSGLTSLTIPDSVTSIGNEAFSSCSGLTSVTIPNSVTSIGRWTFANCSGLTRVDYTGTIADWCGIAFESYSANPLYYAHNLYINGELVTDLVISNTVTKINRYAFQNCTSMTGIIIPDSVTNIGLGAFSGCSSLTSITIPFVGSEPHTSTGTYQYPFGFIFGTSSYDGGTETKQYYYGSSTSSTTNTTYYIPTSLKSVTITGSSYIPYGAFYNCSGLTSVTIPNSVTSIGSSAFSGCIGLTSVTIPNSVTSIGGSAFWNCSGLTSVTIPDSVTSIGENAFYNCSGLTEPVYNAHIFARLPTSYSGSYTIPSGITSILDDAFSGCSGLTGSLTLPDSVTSIGGSAFYGCSGLTGSLTLPDSVTSIGGSAFYGCSGLTSLTIPDSVTSIGGYAFSGCRGLTGSLTIPDSVTSIGDQTFLNCNGLTSVTIPNSVTSIGGEAFCLCSSLTRVDYTGTIADWCGITFSDSTSNPLHYAHNLYIDGELVTNLVIPDSVTSIGKDAFFNCTGLRSVTIPDSVTSIGGSAFYGCSGLKTLVIGSGVASISSGVLCGCSGLTSVTIPFVGDKPHTPGDTYQYPFGYIFGTSSYDGGTLTKQYYYGSSTSSTTNTTYYIPSSLKSVTITGSSYIPYGAFYNCSKLTSVMIPDSVTSIGDTAFTNCSGLTSVTIGCGVTSIGDSAFYNCSGLTSLTIPDSVTSIGLGAFSGCSSLTSITIPFVGDKPHTSTDTYQYPFGYIFSSISSSGGTLTQQYYYGSSTSSTTSDYYYIPSSLKSVTITGSSYIPYGAFYNCSGLTSVTIPNSVTRIGGCAFNNCTSLTTLSVKATTPPTLGSGMLNSCSALTTIYVPTASVSTYKAASGWKDYKNKIVGKEF